MKSSNKHINNLSIFSYIYNIGIYNFFFLEGKFQIPTVVIYLFKNRKVATKIYDVESQMFGNKKKPTNI